LFSADFFEVLLFLLYRWFPLSSVTGKTLPDIPVFTEKRAIVFSYPFRITAMQSMTCSPVQGGVSLLYGISLTAAPGSPKGKSVVV
jgi:hypothetical protein